MIKFLFGTSINTNRYSAAIKIFQAFKDEIMDNPHVLDKLIEQFNDTSYFMEPKIFLASKFIQIFSVN
jgi:hypothetical protein